LAEEEGEFAAGGKAGPKKLCGKMTEKAVQKK
jgi:hypothetical protein